MYICYVFSVSLPHVFVCCCVFGLYSGCSALSPLSPCECGGHGGGGGGGGGGGSSNTIFMLFLPSIFVVNLINISSLII